MGDMADPDCGVHEPGVAYVGGTGHTCAEMAELRRKLKAKDAENERLHAEIDAERAKGKRLRDACQRFADSVVGNPVVKYRAWRDILAILDERA